MTFKAHAIAITLTGDVDVTWFSDGFTAQKHVVSHPNDISIIPAGVSAQFEIKTFNEYNLLQLKPDVIARSVSDIFDINRFEIVSGFNLQDSLIKTLLGQVARAICTSDSLDQLYVDSLTNTLVVHLLKNYASRNLEVSEYEGGLSKYQLDQALDYIQSHLDQDIKLADISELLGMSQYYFCRLFRQSMGVSPYKYVIQQRIELAKSLLRQPQKISIAAIALNCGFTNQSALNKHFRNLTGTTPNTYRKGL
ncbi:MAG: AraC family transcriptional regulator [Cyanobacteria bacterium P01_C01_bin.118]